MNEFCTEVINYSSLVLCVLGMSEEDLMELCQRGYGEFWPTL